MNQVVTEWARQQARELAQKAAKNDDWMEPVFDARDKVQTKFYDPKNWDDYQERHRSSWEETCHFEIKYGHALINLAESQQSREEGFDAWADAYSELKSDFWDEWETQIKLREFHVKGCVDAD